jgi:nitroimidazol reductase NimA-like FMN-containing flavoprotein (pyridoxamine 5'-phosphate oxidase superfamily)
LGGGRNQLSIEEKIMAFKELSRTELEELLSGERIVRIGFEAKGERYLVPLGFISHRGALYAMTRHGRKTRMAALNPEVSFQIDTSATTGPFSWHSVSGEGVFEIVTDSKEIEAISPLLVSRFPDMPQWMQIEYAEKQKKGEVVFVSSAALALPTAPSRTADAATTKNAARLWIFIFILLYSFSRDSKGLPVGTI